MTQPTYLDYNATAPLRPEARQAMTAAFDVCGNPSSVHGFGRAAHALVEDARETLADALGVAAANVVFTGGGTEANNAALSDTSGRPLILSAIEHDSVRAMATDRPDAHVAPVTPNGTVDLTALEAVLDRCDGPAVVAVMAANNETGVVQPIAEIAALVHGRGGHLHCDAVQAFTKIAMTDAVAGADTLAVSAHKFGGPQGVGALVVRDGVSLPPLLRGGGQERGRRAGTHNVAAIAGFAAAVKAAIADEGLPQRLAELRDAMEARILAATNRVEVVGTASPRLPNTSCLLLDGMSADIQVMRLDLAGVAVSAGAACSSGKIAPSHVLAAMGYDDAAAGSAIRVSLGWATTADDVDRFADAYLALTR